MPGELAELLSAARKQRGLSLRQVERETGIHNAHLSQIETGAISRPEPNILWTLAQIYALDFARLMRLAGHVARDNQDMPRRSLVGAALHALDDLTPEEQQQVLEFMDKLRKERDHRRTDRGAWERRSTQSPDGKSSP